MGKLGPLTSQALGRSPYDEVVIGDGEGDLRAPLQLYDERGRPVNPDTKRINKDVVRSHNEVMLVIGVAEPDHNVDESRMAVVRRARYEIREERAGRVLLNIGRALEIGGVWGMNGIRQRILLYRQYANIPFYDLFQHERAQRSASAILFSGLPAFALSYSMKQMSTSVSVFKKHSLLRVGMSYVRMHVHLWYSMQRLGMVGSKLWLPTWKFFVPFSSSSPIPAPPPLESLSIGSILQWLGRAALKAAPFAAFCLFNRLWTSVTRSVWTRIYERMPSPTNPRRRFSPFAHETDERLAEMLEEHINARIGEDVLPRNARDISQDEPTMRALEGNAPAEPIPIGTARRQSTFSSRGDEYVSDDEETEIVNATLISFDVEATESGDTPPGVWSAELRPNPSTDGRIVRLEPAYYENALTRLPSVIATDILTVVASHVLVAPYEAFALRLIARSFRLRRGLPVDDIYDLNPFSALSWTTIANFIGVELIYFLAEADCWGAMVLLASFYRLPDEERKEKTEEESTEPSE